MGQEDPFLVVLSGRLGETLCPFRLAMPGGLQFFWEEANGTGFDKTIGWCSWVWRRRCRYDRSAGPRTGHYSEISAPLANELVGEAVSSCAQKGYIVTAAVVDLDGVRQAILRGDG